MQFTRVDTVEKVTLALAEIPDVVAIDTEYVKGNPRTTKLLDVIIADGDRAWMFTADLLPHIADFIRSRNCIFLQDYNRCDTIILHQNGCNIRDRITHNLIDLHHLLDENADHSLDARIQAEYADNYKEVFWSTYKNYEDATPEDQLEYACKDAIYTYKLGSSDLERVQETPQLASLYEHVRKLSNALLDTQTNGLCVNVELINREYSRLEYEITNKKQLLKLEYEVYCDLWELEAWEKKRSKLKTDSGRLRVPRPDFNFDSDKQVSWLVYEALRCPVVTKTKSGAPSTDLDTLGAIAADRPDIKTLVEFKELKTLFSTFVEGMRERIENGRIYPSFNVSGTSTGRLSHSNPNMGNLPRTGVIRNFFIPSDGYSFIGADYSQLEVVIEANLTEDKQLLKIINEGVSKHDITAQGLGIGRNSAKTLNFALQYGAGVGKVAKILGIPKHEAENIFKRYWELYSGVHALKEKVDKELKDTGQVTNLAGRTRRFPTPENKWEMYKQQRQAYNFLIQGLAAECCNRAFYRFSEVANNHQDSQAAALFSVHDEIIAECSVQDADYWKAELVRIMEEVSKDFNFKYPLQAVAYGPLTAWGKV